MPGLLIGELAARTGVTPSTIRYYESTGLLEPPARSRSGYRRYPEHVAEELHFIRKAQALGFSLDELATILQLSRIGRAPCADVLAMARAHLTAVEERIQQLARFRDHLATEIQKWDGRSQPTCEGLCQIILQSAPDAVADVSPEFRTPKTQLPKRKRGQR
jgi:DNA-binding transcriptional MerR regulator